jgi:hypothetical protein
VFPNPVHLLVLSDCSFDKFEFLGFLPLPLLLPLQFSTAKFSFSRLLRNKYWSLLRLIFPYINVPYPSAHTSALRLLIHQVEVVVACHCCQMVPLLTVVANGMHLYMFKMYHCLKCFFLGEGIFVQATIVDPKGGISYFKFDFFDMSLAFMELL